MIGILVAIGAWIVLMVVSTNLIGLVVRGLFWTPPPISGDAPDAVQQVLENEGKRLSVVNTGMTIFGLLLSVTYLGALYQFWNILLAGVAFLQMCSRFPDLLWEIRNGRRITKGDAPRGVLSYLSLILSLVCLPLTWYALFRWSQ